MRLGRPLMKILIISLFTFIASNFAIAQFELYGAGVVGDTVKIWNTNIYTSCGAEFAASVALPKNSIIVTEQDTSTRHMVCGCYYDVNASLTGLTPGNYQIVIYRQQLRKYQYAEDTLILVASFSFSIAGEVAQQSSARTSASGCHEAPLSVHQSRAAGRYVVLTSYPNPFNPTATIRYSIREAAIVRLEVFNDAGRSIAPLVNEKKEAGEYSIQFDGSKLASGVYFCRLRAGSDQLTNKLVLVK